MTDKYFNEGWFGKHPAIYEFASFFISPIRRRGVRMMGDKPIKILDLATGTGAHAYELAKKGHKVIGVDLDDKMLQKATLKATKENQLEFRQADGTKLPFSDAEFDAATISFAMHDVPAEIGIDILAEAKRVIKKDGFIVIVDYNNLKSSFGAKFLHPFALIYETSNYKPFVKKSLDFYLQKACLKIVDKKTFLGAVQFTKLM